MTIRRILASKGSHSILTISPNATIAEATQMLAEHRIGALVVSADGKVMQGVLSERDIVRELGKRGAGVLEDLVSDLMTSKVTTVEPSDVAITALSKMTSGRFRHLPVMEDGTMIGVISIGDVVKYRMEEMERENSALTDMIVGHG